MILYMTRKHWSRSNMSIGSTSMLATLNHQDQKPDDIKLTIYDFPSFGLDLAWPPETISFKFITNTVNALRSKLNLSETELYQRAFMSFSMSSK